jgi:hypothetical protein
MRLFPRLTVLAAILLYSVIALGPDIIYICARNDYRSFGGNSARREGGAG